MSVQWAMLASSQSPAAVAADDHIPQARSTGTASLSVRNRMATVPQQKYR
jgi:hypothetical protein